MRSLLKPLPRRANLGRYPVLRWFKGIAARAPFLWSFRPSHVLRAIYAGSLIAFMPLVGLQVLIAFIAALMLRANLTIAVALQFITNPLTMAPIYYATWRVGMGIIEATGIGDAGSAMVTRINALVIGGTLADLACALLLHGAFLVLRWEARRFKSHGQALLQLLHLAPDAPSATEDRAHATSLAAHGPSGTAHRKPVAGSGRASCSRRS